MILVFVFAVESILDDILFPVLPQNPDLISPKHLLGEIYQLPYWIVNSQRARNISCASVAPRLLVW